MQPIRRTELTLADEAATEALARTLAARARVGDVIALAGDLGAGKTVFARAFIAARGGADEVPSPTFTLVQTYDCPGGAVWHFDLFRFEDPSEADELDLDDAFADGISLIEWPDRIADRLPADRLEVTLDFGPREGARLARLEGRGSWAERMPEEAGVG